MLELLSATKKLLSKIKCWHRRKELEYGVRSNFESSSFISNRWLSLKNANILLCFDKFTNSFIALEILAWAKALVPYSLAFISWSLSSIPRGELNSNLMSEKDVKFLIISFLNVAPLQHLKSTFNLMSLCKIKSWKFNKTSNLWIVEQSNIRYIYLANIWLQQKYCSTIFSFSEMHNLKQLMNVVKVDWILKSWEAQRPSLAEVC